MAKERQSVFNNGFELAVEVEGKRIPEYGHRGRTYVAGHQGRSYEIKFRNSRAERVLVIPSVDGLNVIDSNPHQEGSPGYVVQPYASLTISGWRSSLSEINRFRFSDRSGSYAGKTKGDQNCGVIGVMVFAEMPKPQPPPPPPLPQEIHHHHHHWPPPALPPPPPAYPWWTTTICRSAGDQVQYGCCINSSAGPTGAVGAPGPMGSPGVSVHTLDQSYQCSSAGTGPDFNLGTAYGESAVDHVVQTEFAKGLWLATMEIYYSDVAGLEKDGVQVSKAPALAVYPSAFGTFCKPPR